MKRNFKTVKTSIIFGLLLVSLFAVFASNASAGLIKVQPLINVTYPPAQENLVPNSGVLQIPLETTFKLTGIGAGWVQDNSLLKDTSIAIDLKVEESNSWIDASIGMSQVELKLTDATPYTSYLKITVTEKAPAFTQGTVKISATSQRQSGILFEIAEFSRTFDVSFVVGYWPVVDYELPKGNLIETGPLNTADFPIEIRSYSNGPTYVKCEIVEIPKGDWSVNIDSSVNLGSAAFDTDTSKATVHLVIKPPYGFGFHNERQTFKVRFTPSYIGKPELTGQTEEVTFTVQSIGMSPGAGFEIPTIIAVIVVIGVFLYIFKRRMK